MCERTSAAIRRIRSAEETAIRRNMELQLSKWYNLWRPVTVDAMNIQDAYTLEEITQRLGISTHFLGPDRLEAETIERIGKAGIKHIELCAGEQLHYDYLDGGQTREIMNACREHAVDVVSFHGRDPMHGLDLYSEDEAKRREAVEETTRAAAVAKEFGAQVFVLHCGATPQATKSITELLRRLEGMSLTLAVENSSVAGARAFDLSDCGRFAERINSPFLGIAVDIGHLVNYVADPEMSHPLFVKGGAYRELQKCGSFLCHIHLHDARGFERRFAHHGAHNDHYPPFLGDIDWEDLFVALKQLEYEGAFMFEPIGWWSERISSALTERLGRSHGDATDIINLVASFPGQLLQTT